MAAPAPASPRTSQPPSPGPRASADFTQDSGPGQLRVRDSDSDSFSEHRTPAPAFDPSAALILVSSHDDDDEEDDDHDGDIDIHADEEHGPVGTTFDFSSDDERREDEDDNDREDSALLFNRARPPSARFRSASFDLSPSPSSRSSSAASSLSSPTVFLYLLSPLLKLGALLSLAPSLAGDADIPLRSSIGALVFFACLCALARQVWYMLARYVRRADVEEMLIQTFARGHSTGRGGEREKRKRFVRRVTRVCTGVLRVLLVALYLRVSTDALLPFLPHNGALLVRLATTPVLALFVSPLCLGASLAAPTALYPTWLSVAAYVGWVACAAYSHAKGFPVSAPATSGRSESFGVLWQGFSIAAFTFTTSSTVPLYAALRGTHEPGVPKPRRSRSFKLLSVLSIVLAALLVLPPAILRASGASESLVRLQTPDPEAPDSDTDSPTPTLFDTPSALRAAMALLSVLTLLLGVPSVLATAPPLPVPQAVRRRAGQYASKVLYLVGALALAVLPAPVCRVASDVLLVLAFLSTYAVPALIHITIHNFRRPLSIVMPPGTPATPSHPGVQRSESYDDELLQRKERTLQRRRLVRRLAWDIGVWVLLLPVSGGGLIWAGGRVLRQW